MAIDEPYQPAKVNNSNLLRGRLTKIMTTSLTNTHRIASMAVRLFKTLLLSAILMTPAIAELPQVNDARVVQPPPGAKVAAAYFTINNTDSDTLEITGVTSDIAKRVEIHLSRVENDVAKMEKQESVSVSAGESLEFKHGSFHVMFMGLNKALVAGESMQLTLNTSAGALKVSVPIISLEDAMKSDDSAKGYKNKDDEKH